MNKPTHILLTCEHASNRVPAGFKDVFAGHDAVLQTHRGYDLGIRRLLYLCRDILPCSCFEYRYTRLLVDPNRRRQQTMFSKYSQILSPERKRLLIDKYYEPYRADVIGAVASHTADRGRVLHLSLHSFTPELNGQIRNVELGILYDPARQPEKQAAEQLRQTLGEQLNIRIRKNYPYLGKSDGVTTWLRSNFPQNQYQGFELEFNQAYLSSLTNKQIKDVAEILCQSILQVVQA